MPGAPQHGIGGARQRLGLRSLMVSLRLALRHNTEFAAPLHGRLTRLVFLQHVQVSGVAFHFGIFGHRYGQSLFWMRIRLVSRREPRAGERKLTLAEGILIAA